MEFHRQYEATPIFAIENMTSVRHFAVSDQENRYEDINHPAYILNRTLRGFFHVTQIRILGTWAFYGGTAFVLAPLGFWLCRHNRKLLWMALLLAFMFAGWEAENPICLHYYAPATPVLYAIGLIGLSALCCWRRKYRLGQLLVLASLSSFALTTAAELAQGPVFKMFNISYHPRLWYDMNFLRQKASVVSILDGIPGNHLVLVHYPQGHDQDREWVYNGYNIPSQRIIWAHDLDPSDPDKPLVCHYRNRHIWFIEPMDTDVWSAALAQKALHPVNTSQMCADSGPANVEHAPELTSAGGVIGVN